MILWRVGGQALPFSFLSDFQISAAATLNDGISDDFSLYFSVVPTMILRTLLSGIYPLSILHQNLSSPLCFRIGKDCRSSQSRIPRKYFRCEAITGQKPLQGWHGGLSEKRQLLCPLMLTKKICKSGSSL